MANEVAVAQSQNLTTTDDKYIKNKPEDLLLVKLNQLAQKVKKHRKTRENFIRHYYSLASIHYALDIDQIKNLGQDEQVALANILFKKVKPMAIFQLATLPVLICIPLLGWISVLCMFSDKNPNENVQSYHYYKNLRKLKLMFGEENWFPYELLK